MIARDAALDFYEAAGPEIHAKLRIRSARVGRIGLIGLPESDRTEFNRGLGFDQPVSKAAFDEAVAWLHTHAALGWAIQIPSGALSNPFRAHLVGAGLSAKGRGWARHVRARTQPAIPAPDHDVRLLGVEAAEDFAAVAQEGFGLPAATREWFAALVGRPRWLTFATYEACTPVAVGAMFIAHGIAWLGFDAILACGRGRGSQRALIAARVADGLARGLGGFVAETRHPVTAGAPAFSRFRPYGRSGFEVANILYDYGP
ncbi:hypothetical protein ACLBXB_06870 [Methylobacterium mesophilicum]